MQGLRADDDGVGVEPVLLRIPAAVVLTAEDAEQGFGFDTAGAGEAVLAVGGEDEVLGASGPSHADLGCFLSEQRCPQAQLSLTLQSSSFGVDAADQDHIPVEAAQILIGEFCCEGIVLTGFDAVSVFGEHLDHSGLRGLTVGSAGSH